VAKLLNLLNKNTFSLLVELPKVDAVMVEAALAGGVDAILFSVSDLQELKESKKEIIRLAKEVEVPVGLSIALLQGAAEKTLKELVAAVDFVEVAEEGIRKIKKIKGVNKLVRLDDSSSMEELLKLSEEGAEVVDAAIIPKSRQQKEMTVGELQQYISIVISAALPVIIPTDLAIKPSEVAILWDAGAKAILLTPNILGRDPRAAEKNILQFRIAVDDLSQ
jgi:GTPase Era involved in 16S rRNA processing